jgi:hypothetical protein
VRDALAKHWPAATFLSIPEAPQNAVRQGRTLDLLVPLPMAVPGI